jgi:hypothetical protein
MGADSFYLYYGVRRTIPLDDEDQIEQLEEDRHPICDLAYKHNLQFTWGCLTDGADYFLLIGRELGCFGVECIHERTMPDNELAGIMTNTKDMLRAAGIKETPAIHCQLQAQY